MFWLVLDTTQSEIWSRIKQSLRERTTLIKMFLSLQSISTHGEVNKNLELWKFRQSISFKCVKDIYVKKTKFWKLVRVVKNIPSTSSLSSSYPGLKSDIINFAWSTSQKATQKQMNKSKTQNERSCRWKHIPWWSAKCSVEIVPLRTPLDLTRTMTAWLVILSTIPDTMLPNLIESSSETLSQMIYTILRHRIKWCQGSLYGKTIIRLKKGKPCWLYHETKGDPSRTMNRTGYSTFDNLPNMKHWIWITSRL